ncbi:hypothetical protein MTR_8g461290 [Medicago truncatula]|uniref:Uncharacterized protein n=1 Tax=Medicago truncatula TaxID=3880 RepID=A0A072TQL4_MEDTR|nr:hypothetical protein MTR_8g461290 [Medicago truncatula]
MWYTSVRHNEEIMWYILVRHNEEITWHIPIFYNEEIIVSLCAGHDLRLGRDSFGSKGNEDLSEKAKVKLSQPMSLKDIAKTCDASARGVISEYAQQFGGGTFSSKYGEWQEFTSWEDLLAA